MGPLQRIGTTVRSIQEPILRTLKEPFVDKNRLDPDELRGHVRDTYFNLRVFTAALALSFPLVLWIGGYLILPERITLLGSMSAYYHTGMRNIFVGVLLFVGAILIIYKGYTNLENYALNLAGLCAWGVAVFPTGAPEGVDAWSAPTFHGLSALLFFFLIAYVCIWRSRDTLDHLSNESRKNLYKWLYRIAGWLMVILPLSSAVLLNAIGKSTVVFWVEFAAVWVFGFYWIVKSFEVNESMRDYSLLQGANVSG